MTVSAIVSPLSDSGKIPVESTSAKGFGVVDAFGLPKVSSERLLKDFQFSESVIQINFDVTTVSLGSISFPGTQGFLLSSGAGSLSSVVIQSKQLVKQPTLEGLISRWPVAFLTPAIVGNIRSFGLNDGVDGWMIRLNGTILEFVQLNEGVETVTPASSWDVPVTPDANIHLWTVQSKATAAGDYDIWYNEDNLVHTIRSLGNINQPQSGKVDLPIRYEDINTTAGTGETMLAPSMTISAEGRQSVKITDGEKDIGLNVANRLNVQSNFSYLMDIEFDDPIDTVNIWDVITSGSGSFSQPANTYTLFLSTTTGATDNILIKSKVLSLTSGAGEFTVFEVKLKFGENNPENHIKEWGYLDSGSVNGVFFRLEDGVFKFVTVINSVENVTSIDGSKPDANFHNFRIEHMGAGEITGSIVNEDKVVAFSSSISPQVGSSEKQPFIRAYNTAGTATTPDDMECYWLRLLDISGTALTFRGRDDNGIFHDVAVNASRRLLVSSEPIAPAPGQTAIADTQFDPVGTVTDSFTTIPSGKVVNVNNLAAGSEQGNGGSKVEVFEAPNGNTVGLIFIAVLFVDASNGQVNLNHDTAAGDGTAAILLRRERFGGGSVEVFGTWTGTFPT